MEVANVKIFLFVSDSEIAARSRRLSSLIGNLRRTSAPECRKSLHYLDNRILSLESPVSKPQKSLFKLLRSTRQSTAQSVVHRNGDIIIMKGGKIVSVRRAGEGKEGSPLLDRLKALQQTTQSGTDLLSGLAGPGHVMFNIVCDDDVEEGKGLVPKKDSDGVSVGSDDVFTQIGSNRLKEIPQVINTSKFAFGVRENDTGTPKINSSKMNASNYDRHALEVETSEHIDCEKSLDRTIKTAPSSILKPPRYKEIIHDTSATGICSDKQNGKKHIKDLPYLLTSLTEKSAGANTSLHPERRHVVVCVNREDDPLSVMPLTPYTRDSLAKSDLHVSRMEPNVAHGNRDSQALVHRSLQASHSSENLFRKPLAVQRLMSVEFLDPPIPLFGSKSNSANRQNEKSKLHNKKKYSGSTEGKLNSKTLCLRSPFTARKLITQV